MSIKKSKSNKSLKILIIILVILSLLIVCLAIYFGSYYKATDEAKKYLESNDNVHVSKFHNGYYFDGIGDEEALIFYPGAKVEAISYAPLLYKLADSGIDCFLVEMPFNFAFFNPNVAGKIIDGEDQYKKWYLSGHSLGGVVASSYVNKNSNKISGLILLASYPNEKIDDEIPLLLIYGDKDGVLNIDNYNKSKQNWSLKSKEVVLEGANHAQFGNYGNQKGDNNPEITYEVQQEETVKNIVTFLSE